MRDFLVKNAAVIAPGYAGSPAQGMLVIDGRVSRLVTNSSGLGGWTGEVLDCQGAAVLPGFVDAHCHPPALGAHLEAVDCTPAAVASIEDIKVRLRDAAVPGGGDGWIRAVGYDELLLRERRHPTRHDLDMASPSRPVLLSHGSGHAAVVNSVGLALLGIGPASAEPRGATIDREPESGEPSGLLLEMAGYIAGRLPPLSGLARAERLRRAARALLSAGVTSVTDAGERNDAARTALYRELAREAFPMRTTVMLRPGAERLAAEMQESVIEGPTKLMLTCSGGKLSMSAGDIVEVAESERAAGSPGVAIHAVEADAVLAAAAACQRVRREQGADRFATRIEHAAEAPTDVIAAIAASGAAVVTQPGFIRARGDRYLRAESCGGPPADELYPLRSLLDAGVRVGAGSDAPYGPWRPLEAIGAAVARLSHTDAPVGRYQAISACEAVRLYGGAAAAGPGRATHVEPLSIGALADFVVLGANPLDSEPAAIAEIEVIGTYIAGKRVWPRRDA